jgi:AraC-like DNA-binding protein
VETAGYRKIGTLLLWIKCQCSVTLQFSGTEAPFMLGSRNPEITVDQRESPFGNSRWVAPAEDEPLRYVLPVALPGTEFIFARNCTRRWRVFHESYVMCLCVRASAQWLYKGRVHQPLSDHCFMLMEPGETHVNVKIPSPQTYVVMRIGPEALARAAVELGVPRAPHFSLALGHDPVIWRAFERLATCVADEGTALEQQSRFIFGVRLLLEHCIERPRAALKGRMRVQYSVVEHCKNYLQERYNHSVSLDELAALVGLSRFHLLRCFQRSVGVPPHTYQVQLRVEHACKLLQAGMRPSLVASAVGFADQSHLTRHFRRVMYITPGAYRAARQ